MLFNKPKRFLFNSRSRKKNLPKSFFELGAISIRERMKRFITESEMSRVEIPFQVPARASRKKGSDVHYRLCAESWPWKNFFWALLCLWPKSRNENPFLTNFASSSTRSCHFFQAIVKSKKRGRCNFNSRQDNKWLKPYHNLRHASINA